MPPDVVAQIVSSALSVVSAIAPGLLSGLTGHATDDAMIAAARNACARIPSHPAASAIAAVRAQTHPDLVALRAHIEVAKVTTIAGPLRTREREAVEALIAHAERA